MSQSLYSLVMTAHVLGMVLWISGLTAIYWMLRFHDHAPKSSHEQLTLADGKHRPARGDIASDGRLPGLDRSAGLGSTADFRIQIAAGPRPP